MLRILANPWWKGNKNSGKAKGRKRSRSSRPTVERLEDRTLLSVTFTPGPYAIPANNTDTALGLLGATFSPVEPQVTVNPADPVQLAVSSLNGLEFSNNAGSSLTPAINFPVGNSGDTSTAFNPSGQLFWNNFFGQTTGYPNGGVGTVQVDFNPASNTVTVDPNSLPDSAGHLPSNAQVDSAPNGTNDDKSFMAADPWGNLYVAWDQFGYSPGPRVYVSRLAAGTNSWSIPTQVSQAGETGAWPATVAVSPFTGDVYVAYNTQTYTAAGVPDGTSGQIHVARFTNDLQFISNIPAFPPGGSDVTENKQNLPGTIPGTDFFTAGSRQGWVLADPTRPGNIYVVAADDPDNVHGSGDDADVVFARSTDDGMTWTQSTIESGPNNVSGFINNSFQLFPTAAIDKFGNVVVAWYDNRKGAKNQSGNYLLDVFAKYSTDGGVTWSPAFQVNDQPIDPDLAVPFRDPSGAAHIGDYFGVSLYGGTAYVTWTGNGTDGNGNPQQQVFFDKFAINGSLAVTGDNAANNVFVIQAVPGNPSFVQVMVNGNIEYAGLASALTGITVNESNANDTVNIENTFFGVPATVNEGGGTDTVNLSPSAQFLDNLQGNVFVFGGSGVDTLNVDDQNDIFSDTFTITGSTITRNNTAVFSYTLQNNVNINGGSGNLTYNIQSTEGGGFGPTTTVDTGTGTDTVNVQATGSGGTLNIEKVYLPANSSHDTVNIGSNAPSLGGTLANIAGTVNVSNSSGGGTTLNVDDSGDTTGRTFTVTNGSISGYWPGSPISYIGGQVTALNIFGGDGGNTFNVQSTASGTSTSINTDDTSTASANTVNIGSLAPSLGGTLANIAGPLSVGNTSGSTAITLDDSGDTTGQTVTVTNSSITGTWSPAAITYNPGFGSISSLSLLGGDGGNTFNVQSTATGTSTTINTDATATASANTVNIGSLAPSLGGTLANIAGPLSVGNTSGSTAITLDDSGDTTGQTVTVTNSSITGTWSPAAITYNPGFGSISSLSLLGGDGGNTFNVQSTLAGTTTSINTDDTSTANTSNHVIIGSTAPTLGGTLTNIAGPAVNVGSSSGSTTLTVDDSGDGSGHTVSVTNSSISGLSPASIGYSQVSSLTILGPAAGSTYNIDGTAAGTTTTVTGGAGNDIFNITPTSQNFANIAGALVLNGAGGTNTLTVDDQLDPDVNDAYSIGVGSVQRTFTALVTYTSMASELINGGPNNVTFNVNATAASTPVTIEGGAGNDIFNIASGNLDVIAGGVSVNGGGGNNTVNVNDSTKTGVQTYTVTGSTISRAGFAGLTSGAIQTLVLTGGTGADIYNIQSTSAATTVNGGVGSDTFNVGSGGVINGIVGALTVNGNGGTNILNVNDQGTASGSYTVSSTVLSRLAPSAVSITYGTVKTLNLNTGTLGGATLTVLAPVPTTTINYNAAGPNNTLVGAANLGNTFVITGLNKGTLGKVNFSDVQNLTGGNLNDTFKFSGAAASISGNINGGAGTGDKLDYSANGGGVVTVNLQTGKATSIGGTFSNIESLVGSTNAGNTLTGANTTNLWSITGLNLGKVNAFSYSAIEHLVGGTGLDTFKFSLAGKETSIVGSGAPAGQGDWLDYSSFGALNPVSVDLTANTATGVSGAIAGIQNVIGGAGADFLKGNSLGNILIEHGGAGTIIGGSGRSLLIRGTGAANVTGGSGNDILIGGKTSYDTANHVALMAILAEWQSADPYSGLGSRTDKISDGLPGGSRLFVGVGGTVTLSAGGSLNDGPAAGFDWYFAAPTQAHETLEAGEILTSSAATNPS